ncbi:Glycosyltransferase [Chitinispirillum alkaliphilum]|nr:Glycosyltransferase [Chitinispirillum alkaliphilum]
MFRKTKIGIDCRPLENSYSQRGIGTVVRNLLLKLHSSPIAKEIVLFGTSKNSVLSGFDYKRIFRPSYREWVWEQLLWPLDLSLSPCKLFHSMVSLGPLRSVALPYFSPIRSMATIYDFNSLKCDTLEQIDKTRSFKIQKSALKKQDAIVTFSDFVKNELIDLFNIDEKKVSVLSLGVDEDLRTVYDSDRFPNPATDSYILSLGETANKNIHTVIRVYEKLVNIGYDGELRIVGSFDKQIPAVRELYNASKLRERIHFLSNIDTPELVANYSGAQLFLFPSLCEGFGFPVLEAMYCNTPVVCSFETSLKEVGGNAPLYRAALDVNGYAEDSWNILSNAELREKCVRAGRRNAESRSWVDAVDQLIQLYEVFR